MKEYMHGKVTIRIHDAENIELVQRRKQLEDATIKLMREVMKNVSDKTIPTSRTSAQRDA